MKLVVFRPFVCIDAHINRINDKYVFLTNRIFILRKTKSAFTVTIEVIENAEDSSLKTIQTINN